MSTIAAGLEDNGRSKDSLVGETFDAYYIRNSWGNEESKSGPGSTIENTGHIRLGIEQFCKKWPVKRFFDAPCGDFHWMKEVQFPPGLHYTGADIAPSLVADLERKYASETRQFFQFDIIMNTFPDADVWFCRDCLIHLSYEDIYKALENFSRSRITYIFVTSAPNVHRLPIENRDIVTGDCRPVNLFAAPFSFHPWPEFYTPDYAFPNPYREMLVWTRQQIVEALPRMRAWLDSNDRPSR